ncbi:uncharacterized protein B0H64DRAFT_396905 [Chaetomium fimeti]|uniref:Secreted protein n=1 Tax=Chaetomium fimeti TaxID=1854472 RepID=A0AAE0HGD4_9PEZI|nr:hypothetical protein B0H64DRAFT_396905 [Chaetomium fimeti]
MLASALFSIFGTMCWTRDADEKPPRTPRSSICILLHSHQHPGTNWSRTRDARRPIPATRTVDSWVHGFMGSRVDFQ